jgi:hypothetical protein
MRLFGLRRHPLSEIRSRDDATLARSGGSTTELLRLVNVGPFFKAFGTAICQGNIHLHTFSNSGQTRYGVYFKFYPVFCAGRKQLIGEAGAQPIGAGAGVPLQ